MASNIPGLPMTTFPRERVKNLKRVKPLCAIGYAVAATPKGMKRNVVLTAHTKDELKTLFKLMCGGEIDERGVYRVAILNKEDILLDDDL